MSWRFKPCGMRCCHWISGAWNVNRWPLKVKATWSDGTVPHLTVRCHIPQDLNPQRQHCKNLKSRQVTLSLCSKLHYWFWHNLTHFLHYRLLAKFSSHFCWFHFPRVHHHHHHHISFMELGHLLTRSSLTYPEVSPKVYHDNKEFLCITQYSPTQLYFI